MCGIAGFVLAPTAGIDPASVLRMMTNQLAHRGPDGGDSVLESDGAVGLGHRRLAIVDLSEAGRQPMVSHSGRYVITYNGEVYNFQELRRELEITGAHFRGHSDTEVMLAAMDAWGISAAIRRLAGMFAFALWDRRERELWLVRDRLGKKPLYVGTVKGSLVFGSELKAIRAFPGFDAEIDRGALALQMRHNYIPAPYSIYRTVGKIEPGTFRRVRIRAGIPVVVHEEPYWSARTAFADGHRQPFDGTADEAVEALDSLLRKAVMERLVSDVPLGAFLSGGIDSSTVAALMQAQSVRPVKTFSIGFEEAAYNEAPHARAVAQHLGTDHTEVCLTAADAMAVVPLLPTIYDEPFSDSSQIPTFLVSQVARQQVTVSLSGDGGDELFCGYPRYRKWRAIWRQMVRLPAPLRRSFARVILGVSIGAWDRILGPAVRWRNPRAPAMSPGDKLHKLAEIVAATTPEAVYRRLVSHWMNPAELVAGAVEPPTPLSQANTPRALDDFTDYMMLLDVLTYLPDDILVKVDRASMAVSLEARCPLLDHRVVELAVALPLSLKLRDGTDKWVLRQVLARYVPPHLFERPKMGFGVPIDAWLRGPLRPWAEDLLDEYKLRQDGLLNPGVVRAKWREFIDQGYPWHYPLWDVLMFQAWLRNQSVTRDQLATQSLP
jgi:asparagine synthase (glutamine-hydrolysing)